MTLDEEKAFFAAEQSKTPWRVIAAFCLGAQHGIDVARRKMEAEPFAWCWYDFRRETYEFVLRKEDAPENAQPLFAALSR